ncbi:MAG: hypothetical protein FWB76_07045 [Oscillospiraceae bacterium]|nr:hypothetical protein [Oscillospiraceae bacterium]
MKKLIGMLVALGLLLAACSPALPVVVDETTATTEAYTTTEAEPHVFVPMQGEANGFAWRTIDLVDPAEAESRAWIEAELARAEEAREARHELEMRQWEEGYVPEFQMGDVVVFNRDRDDGLREIVMRDADGVETVLVAPRVDTWSYEIVRPTLREVLTPRFFIMTWGFETWGHSERIVFDLQTRREYPVVVDFDISGADGIQSATWLGNGDVMYWTPFTNEAPYIGRAHLLAANLENLPHITFTDLTASIDHEPLVLLGGMLLCPEERFYILVCEWRLTVFDLQEQSVLQLYKRDMGVIMGSANRPNESFDFVGAYLQGVLLRGNTIYWFSEFANDHLLNMNIAVQITLP